MKIERALISVSDKSGLDKLAQYLTDNDIEIISSGGTKKHLEQNGFKVKAVEEITNFPEILDGRVKTLHPDILGAILAKRNEEHLRQLNQHGIATIDLVVVNLYPFESTVSREDCSMEEAIEQIDIGGPSLIRAAAKNFNYTTVVTDAGQYDDLIDDMKHNNCETSEIFRLKCAEHAFRHVARYNILISDYFTTQIGDPDLLPEEFVLQGRKIQDLRYGENPHQFAAFYKNSSKNPLNDFEQLHGKELSFNNILDLNAALSIIRDFDRLICCVILKHNNPCGAAIGDTVSDAFKKALQTDPVSAFGGIIGINQSVDLEAAEEIAKMFIECIIAPGFSSDALARLNKKKNIRLIKYNDKSQDKFNIDIKAVMNGWLIQQSDNISYDIQNAEVVSKRKPTDLELKALDFAWRIVKHVKSNAIIFCSDDRLLGVGAGQMSRVDSTKVAIMKAKKAGISLKKSVVASDAFFPFRDGVEALAQAGATAVIQPGGSVRDQEVIDAANENGLAMIFTRIRHFKH